ncbi:MAG: hisN [Chloroflexi bacterium]|nr:hisN [Chloroflexota bacterium]
MTGELAAAIAAARAAGRLQRRRFGRRESFQLKADDTPVTATDRDSEDMIRKLLTNAVPGGGFLGEESGETAPEANVASRWIVDPLDGTKKFVRGLPFFGPCIALEVDSELQLGVMHLPAFKQTIWAERGAGAFLDGEPIHVSDQGRLDRAYVVYSSEAEFIRRGWSSALERLIVGSYHNPGFLDLYSYAMLACGRIDAIINIGESPWDIAAARVIVEEAGGRLTDFQGNPTVYAGTAVTSNGHLHEQLLRILRDL